MAQRLYVDFRDGYGERDYTKFLSDVVQFTKHELNKPAMFDFTLVPVGDTTAWKIPTRGAFIRFEDSRWLSRVPGVRPGVLFTGYITEDPQPRKLGKLGLWSFICPVTSEDYLSNIKSLPHKTYINKTRGFIIKDLLATMFATSPNGVPYNLDNVYDGGIERIFQVDTTTKFTDLVAAFAKADNFTYYVIDNVFVYAPRGQFMPTSNDPKLRVVVDEADPRFTPEGLTLNRVGGAISNDVTVFGNDEATTMVRERFISDGYSGFFQLAFEPFGAIEQSLLKDDLTGEEIDDSIWEEKDEAADYIRAFEGSLNIIGGAGGGAEGLGSTYLRSRKGVELSGILTFRDGELQFPPTPTGAGIIGGLYTDADAVMSEEDLILGWRIDLDSATKKLYPWGPDGQETDSGFTLDTTRHYVLRKHVEVDRQARNLNSYVSAGDDFSQVFAAETGVASSCTVTWTLEEINASDPDNVVTTHHTVLRKTFLNVNDFGVYAPVVSYDMHVVLNYIEIFKPQQVSVLVDDTPVQVGNALDGARCAITTEGGPRLNWYANPMPSQSQRAANPPPEVVTIPPQGAKVEVLYWRKDKSRARLINAESVASERARYKDDGVRQMVIQAGDVLPIPNTSEECQALAQAYIADRTTPRYEGSYSFDVAEDTPTELNYWIFPGDLLHVHMDLPDGTTIDQRVLVSSVDSSFTGNGAYRIALQFGAIDKIEETIRQLVMQRASSLDDASIETVEPLDTVVVSDLALPPDPSDWSITNISTTQLTVQMASVLPDGVVGYEVRVDDTGWGQPNYVVRFTGTTSHTFNRNKRDQSYYIRPFDADGNYSRRSAFVRVVYPLPNTMVLTGLTGEIHPERITIDIPLPNDPDLAGVAVRLNDEFGATLYQGDGVQTQFKDDNVNAIAGTSRLTVEIPNTAHSKTYTVWVAPYDLLNALGTGAAFTVTKPTLAVSSVAPSPTDPGTFTWVGTADWFDITLMDEAGGVIKTWMVPGEPGVVGASYLLAVGDEDIKRTFEVIAQDSWSSIYPDTYPPPVATNTKIADSAVPAQPVLAVMSSFEGSEGKSTFTIEYTFAAPTHLRTCNQFEWNWSTVSDFSSSLKSDTTTPINSANEPYKGTRVFIEPKRTLYIRLRAKNKFGTGPWSTTLTFTSGSALDPIALGGAWNFSDPIVNSPIKLAAGGYTFGNANDGTGRAITGLTLVGDLGRPIPNGIQQYDGFGIQRTIFRIADHNFDNVGDGGTYARTTYNQRDGGGRGFTGLDISSYLVTGVKTGGNTVSAADIWLDNAYTFGAIEASNDHGVSDYRVRDDAVDALSIIGDGVAGVNIRSAYRSANGLTSGGGGYNQEYP